MSDRPLFARFPEVRSRVPFRGIATLPTPVERIPSLGLWVKRDDRTHPGLGGGKVRKIEFYLPDPDRPALAYGPRASNWLAALQHFGPPHRILTFPQPMNLDARRAARSLRPTRAFSDAFHFALGAMAELPRILGDSVRLAPPGGTDAVTTLGYVNAALELADQVRAGECPEPDAVFVGFGSGGTAAGLTLGLALAGLRSTVFAVRIAHPIVARRRTIEDVATQCAWLLDLKAVPAVPLRIVGEFFGGYARPIPAGRAAQRRFSDEGLALDCTYTAKVGAAVLAYRNRFRHPLFWYTAASGPRNRITNDESRITETRLPRVARGQREDGPDPENASPQSSLKVVVA